MKSARIPIRTFGLKTMLGVVAVLCAWLAFERNGASARREAVAALRSRGAEVIYDYDFKFYWSAALNCPCPTPGPAWAREFLDEDLVCDVVAVNLQGLNVGDAELTRLRSFKHLLCVQAEDTAVSDVGLRSLYALRSLRLVCLTGSQATPKGVASLRTALPNCRVAFHCPARRSTCAGAAAAPEAPSPTAD